MKFVLMVIALVFSSISALAATEPAKKNQYMVSAAISIDGKIVSNPRISTVEGEEAVITQKDEKNANLLSLRVVAKESVMPNNPKNKGVLLEMELLYKKHGKEIHSKPQILVLEGETGTIEVGEASGSNFAVEVTAKKIN